MQENTYSNVNLDFKSFLLPIAVSWLLVTLGMDSVIKKAVTLAIHDVSQFRYLPWDKTVNQKRVAEIWKIFNNFNVTSIVEKMTMSVSKDTIKEQVNLTLDSSTAPDDMKKRTTGHNKNNGVPMTASQETIDEQIEEMPIDRVDNRIREEGKYIPDKARGRVVCFLSTEYDIESDIVSNTTSFQIPYDVVGVRGDRPNAPVQIEIIKMSAKQCQLNISSDRETGFIVEFEDFVKTSRIAREIKNGHLYASKEINLDFNFSSDTIGKCKLSIIMLVKSNKN